MWGEKSVKKKGKRGVIEAGREEGKQAEKGKLSLREGEKVKEGFVRQEGKKMVKERERTREVEKEEGKGRVSGGGNDTILEEGKQDRRGELGKRGQRRRKVSEGCV